MSLAPNRALCGPVASSFCLCNVSPVVHLRNLQVFQAVKKVNETYFATKSSDVWTKRAKWFENNFIRS